MAAMVGSQTGAAGLKCDFYGRISAAASMAVGLMQMLGM